MPYGFGFQTLEIAPQMKGPRPVTYAVIIASMIGGLVAPIGCGSHPEEGMLKLPVRKGRADTVAAPAPAKTSTKAGRNRKAPDGVLLGK